MMAATALAVRDVSVRFGPIRALQGVSLDVVKDKVTAVVGTNGAGKSTLLRAIAGLVPLASGVVECPPGRDLRNVPSHRRVQECGIALVPENRAIFQRMTVADNLAMGARVGGMRRDSDGPPGIEQAVEMFPVLGERAGQLAGSLSGGEQQMLSIARALLMEPTLLLLDEPSSGLAPVVVERVFEQLTGRLSTHKLSVLLVEQNTRLALDLADSGYVIERGTIQFQGGAEELREDRRVEATYLGL